MNHELAIQEQGHRTWCIVRLFYTSLVEFLRQYDSYEDKVLRLARETGIHRDVLRLRATELAALLDFKSLEGLRDGYILELKDLCHEVFRTKDHTDPLDRYVADIFHEISILKEEHYTVKTYAPLYEKAAAKVELQYILDEAHAMFPQKLKQVLYLFGKAQERMEQHLGSFASAPIFIRSLYVHRDGFVADAYPDGLRDFYRFMYPCGPLEGFYHVGLSFYHSGFFPEGLEAFRLAEAEHDAALGAARAVARSRSSAHAAGNGHGGGNGALLAREAAISGSADGDAAGARAPGPPSVDAVRAIYRSLRAKIRRLDPEVRPAQAPDPAARQRSGAATVAGRAKP